MKIKCGRKTYDVHIGDSIMFNGHLYILMIGDKPPISKALFKKLVREDVVVKRGYFNSSFKELNLRYDRFVFVKEDFDL